MEIPVALALILIFGFGAAFVSLLEVLIAHLRSHRARALARQKPHLDVALQKLSENREPLLSALVTIGAVLTLAVAVLAFYLISEVALPAGWPLGWTVAGVFVATVLLGDILPKILALGAPSSLLSVLARPLASILPALLGPAKSLHSLGDRIAGIFVSEEKADRSLVEGSELETLVQMRTETGVLADDEAEIIHEILKLSRKTAKDCMTPRLDAAILDIALPAEQLLAESCSLGHRFIPLYQGDPDGIVGILNVRDFLEAAGGKVSQFVHPPVFVPENANALQLFERQLAEPGSLAIVLDEYGNVEGVVSHSDVVEDMLEGVALPDGVAAEISELGEHRYLAASGARIEELEELCGRALGGEGLDTLGGLLFNEIGRIPKQGETHIIHGLEFTVRKVRRNRIEELLILLPEGGASKSIQEVPV